MAILWLSVDGARSSAMRDLALGASATLLLALVLTVAALRTEAWARTAAVGCLAAAPVVNQLHPRPHPTPAQDAASLGAVPVP